MLRGVHRLLDEADVVVHYNGKSFDIPTLNKAFLMHEMPPPAPYKQLDMLTVARNVFKFTSNKMDYIAQELKIGEKVKHAGYQLWIDCMANKSEAWAKMEKYNKNDVVLLEGIYERFAPWIPNHPAMGMYDKDAVCPLCGGQKRQCRGPAHAHSVSYQRYQCMERKKNGRICGKWYRGTDMINGRAKYVGING